MVAPFRLAGSAVSPTFVPPLSFAQSRKDDMNAAAFRKQKSEKKSKH
jgi:hypothetical protein